MSAPMWEDRGHAAKITAAAKAAGARRRVGLGFSLAFDDAAGKPLLFARFNAKGVVHRSSVRSVTKPAFLFAESLYTASEATALIVAWFEAGTPETFDPMPVLTARWMR